ncbi:Methyl-accepting chemotaxis protein CtpL [Psychrobacter pasteurii]|uniref:Methyl-accepting chemotaxis protein CtpL n=1 Tax=Psychrobacter pasteurii TaxID=1945520 RepID=A0A1R4ED49_9GAMM|nr:Methyl-accepting chemotaxis protein CtpL [Psychrobacter pasteurii]
MKDAAQMPANTPSVSPNKKGLSNQGDNQKKWVYLLLALGLVALISLIYLMVNANKVSSYVSAVNQLEVSSSHLARHVNEAVFTTEDEKRTVAQKQLTAEMTEYQSALDQVQNQSFDDSNLYKTIDQRWQQIKPEVQSIIDHDFAKDSENDSEGLFVDPELQQSADKVGTFVAETQSQLQPIDRHLLSRSNIILPALLFLLSLLGSLYAIYRLYHANSQTQRLLIEKETLRQRDEMDAQFQRARSAQDENEKNQAAILRLLDELEYVAEGDLTVNATVTEDITGAIADSVNFAIEQLRHLVQAINDTAASVTQSSQQTQLTATELAAASEQQAQKIASVSAAIADMVNSIKQVSTSATQSASVADRSVAIAHNGAQVVQRSIDGMSTIREQIQETSKRIKRLGESSQEIGDIVGLINDIADQTNVLALNAAIQASMAGEAGRGFAVVADEVQRLAERSANATKQIEGLVKTIQADTNEAVMSMESTTTEVVQGAKLATDAGEALKEVQTVSSSLADLIQQISNEAQLQASSAGQISQNMEVIQQITSTTTAATRTTADSVGQLNEMAASLQKSVSGFKLEQGGASLKDL